MMKIMKAIPYTLLGCLVAGYLLSYHFKLPELILQQDFYVPFVYFLLSIGLYGSVVGIDLEDAKEHKKTIVLAVTMGVLMKTLIIFTICYFFIGSLAFIVAPIVAQIDPLAIASLMDNSNHRLSKSGQAILRAWSSFDDPMTVLVAIYISFYFFVQHSEQNFLEGITNYISNILFNCLIALAFYFIHKKIIRHIKNRKKTAILECLMLVVAIINATIFQFSLSVALIGLFLRPDFIITPKLTFNQFLNNVVNLAFYASVFLLGILIVKDIRPFEGAILGASAIIAQSIATFFLIPKKHSKDKIYLAISQYNGITAIILALFFEKYISGTVAIVACAIFVINLLHPVFNSLADHHYKVKQTT